MDTNNHGTHGMEDPAIVASFLDEAEERLDTVNRLLIEAEACREIKRDQAEQLQRTLHNLKGAARMVGLVSFERLVHILEDLVKLVLSGKFELKAVIPLFLEGIDELGIVCRQMRDAGRLSDGEDLETTIIKLAVFLPDEGEAAVDFAQAPPPGPKSHLGLRQNLWVNSA